MASVYLATSGMTPAHFEVFRSVAQQQQRIIIVRNTNPKCVPWIALGYPPKPKELESLHTAADTGKVTAQNAVETDDARRKGFFVLDKDGVARNALKLPLPTQFPINAINQAGQVIHPQKHLALVGDYDLMGVVDPAAPGRVLTLVTVNGVATENRTNPDVERVRSLLNAQFDQPRIMHGPQDLYKSFRGACTVFEITGEVLALPTEQAVQNYYTALRRQTVQGRY